MNKKLIAIDPCYMDGNPNDPALTVGKEYEIIRHKQDWTYIIDDAGAEHSFSEKDVEIYFREDRNEARVAIESAFINKSPLKGPNSKLIEAIELFSSSYPEEEIMEIITDPENYRYKVLCYSNNKFEINLDDRYITFLL